MIPYAHFLLDKGASIWTVDSPTYNNNSPVKIVTDSYYKSNGEKEVVALYDRYGWMLLVSFDPIRYDTIARIKVIDLFSFLEFSNWRMILGRLLHLSFGTTTIAL